MKRYMMAALLLVLSLVAGCSIGQDYSVCTVDNNCVLLFRMMLDGNDSDFDDNIDNVTVVLYDAQDNYILHRIVDRSELAAFAGTKLTVEPGDYRVVCWGNVSAASQLVGLGAGGTFTTAYLETVSDVCGCPLYYGPRTAPKSRRAGEYARTNDYTAYGIHVPENSTTQKEICFTRAHRAVKVYVQGYERHPDYDNNHPELQLTNMPHRYDFFLNAVASCKHYQTGMAAHTPTGSEAMSFGRINTPITDIAGDMHINIRRSSNDALLATVNLQQYIADNASLIDDTNDIEILIEFDASANVTISMPDWDEIEVNPLGNK